jgi:hypothetical protein
LIGAASIKAMAEPINNRKDSTMKTAHQQNHLAPRLFQLGLEKSKMAV